jgi:hypothetical protein
MWTQIAVLVGLLGIACGSELEDLTIRLVEQDVTSEQSGTATLTAKGSRTEVVLRVTPGPVENDPQPVHIHFGDCGANLGSVHIGLNSVEAGKSTTLVDANLLSLVNGNFAVNLHKSQPEIRVYTSCGNIEK